MIWKMKTTMCFMIRKKAHMTSCRRISVILRRIQRIAIRVVEIWESKERIADDLVRGFHEFWGGASEMKMVKGERTKRGIQDGRLERYKQINIQTGRWKGVSCLAPTAFIDHQKLSDYHRKSWYNPPQAVAEKNFKKEGCRRSTFLLPLSTPLHRTS